SSPTAAAERAAGKEAPAGAQAGAVEPAKVVAVEPIAAEKAEEILVATPLYSAKLSNVGGALDAFVLSRFKDAKGEPLDLVRHGAGFPGRTLVLEPKDPFETRAAKALYRVEREEAAGETRVVLTYREADGNGIRRTYVFRRDSYVMPLKVERLGAEKAPVAVPLGPG